jgi:hypothetical protein
MKGVIMTDETETAGALGAQDTPPTDRERADHYAGALEKALLAGQEAVTKLEATEAERDKLIDINAALRVDLEKAPTADQLAALTAERDDAVAALEKAKADADATPKAKAAPKPAKARKVGPVKDQPTREDLMTFIAAAETVELVFSDGKTEIAGIPALRIEGTAWALTPVGVQLQLPSLLVHGPGVGQSAYSLAGYGLLLDGELTAYAARGEQLTIGANSQFELKDDVVFG